MSVEFNIESTPVRVAPGTPSINLTLSRTDAERLADAIERVRTMRGRHVTPKWFVPLENAENYIMVVLADDGEAHLHVVHGDEMVPVVTDFFGFGDPARILRDALAAPKAQPHVPAQAHSFALSVGKVKFEFESDSLTATDGDTSVKVTLDNSDRSRFEALLGETRTGSVITSERGIVTVAHSAGEVTLVVEDAQGNVVDADLDSERVDALKEGLRSQASSNGGSYTRSEPAVAPRATRWERYFGENDDIIRVDDDGGIEVETDDKYISTNLTDRARAALADAIEKQTTTLISDSDIAIAYISGDSAHTLVVNDMNGESVDINLSQGDFDLGLLVKVLRADI